MKNIDYIEKALIHIFYIIIDFQKKNTKNFCRHLDKLLVKINKFEDEIFNNVFIQIKKELDENFLFLTNKIIYIPIRSNLYFGLEKLPLFENLNSFIRCIMNKDHLKNFLLIIAITFLSKKISHANARDNYINILKDNLNFNAHKEDINDSIIIDKLAFCQSILIYLEKIDKSINSNVSKTNGYFRQAVIEKSRNTKSKDVSNVSKNNNSYDSSRIINEERLNKIVKDNKISNFQKYIKNVNKISF